MSINESFYSTIFNKNHLPLGVWLHDNFSTFHDSYGFSIVRCVGRWPDHDLTSGEACDPHSPIPDWDQNLEFYEDSIRPGAQVLYQRETEVFLRDLVTSTPALEKEIRRRDDADRVASEANRKAGEERARLRDERERQRREVMTPQERAQEDDAARARLDQAIRSAVRKPPRQHYCCCGDREPPKLPLPSAPSQIAQPPAPQGFGGYIPPSRGNFRRK